MNERWLLLLDDVDPLVAMWDDTRSQPGHFIAITYGPHRTHGAFMTKERTKDSFLASFEKGTGRHVRELRDYKGRLGSYHPRIWRESDVQLSADEKRALVQTGTSAASLLEMLQRVFFTVEPNGKTASTFGQQLRHLLILACTEIEAGWKGILRANGYALDRMTTNDYVKLAPVMRVSDWMLRLSFYPDFGELSPFAGWDPAKPTDSLAWYSAYNAVKHDREKHLDQATLGNVINATAALMIICAAQFGPGHWIRYTFGGSQFSQSVFEFEKQPSWLPEDRYFAPEQGNQWEAIPHRF